MEVAERGSAGKTLKADINYGEERQAVAHGGSAGDLVGYFISI
jgi:hypothetical protein